MNILVTGGAGFIGSAVAQRLFADGHHVMILDDFNAYYDVELKRARAAQLPSEITVIEGSITDVELLESVFASQKFDAVCHLAAQAGVRYSLENPHVYVETNVQGTFRLLEAMRMHGVNRMVYASTSSIYGNDTPAPFTEDAVAHAPVSVYAATKKAGELLAHTYSTLYGMDVTCLRFFTVYGPWGRPDMALYKFVNAIQQGQPIDVYNEGKLRRDFTYIDDIVEGFVQAVERPMGYQIINLGNGSPVELLQFIDVIESELGQRAQKNMLPMQQGDVFETYADIRKAQELLGYQPKTKVEEGVREFVKWYKDFYK